MSMLAPRHLTVVCCLALLACAKSKGGGEIEEEDLGEVAADLRPALPPPDAGVEDAAGRDAACGTVRVEATLSRAPVDIILVVANSANMTDKNLATERNLTANLADQVGKSLDYRIILLSKYGFSIIDQSMCIPMPLSGNPSCLMPPLCPLAGTRFFHYSTPIGATDSLKKILDTYNARDFCGSAPTGWATWLRTGALKVFVELTDDNSAMTSDEFDTKLLAKTPRLFGDAMARDYVFHTIGGLKESSPATQAWQPTDPLQMDKCTRGGGVTSNSLEYQKLSVLTGGLRFAACEHASFATVFRNLAQGIIDGSRVACDFPVPTPTGSVDPASLTLEYQVGGVGAARTFKKVAGGGSCAADSFYVNAGRAILCPEACKLVLPDSKAKISAVWSCLLG